MVSTAKQSPTARGITDIKDRVSRLEAFEQWRNPIRIDFESILGTGQWEEYWSLCEKVLEEMRLCQEVADSLRTKIIQTLK
jgi:hypothetical protein